jgi:hypothetical protein
VNAATHPSLLLVAFSPLIVFGGLILTGIAFDSASGAVPGFVLLYMALSVLVFVPGVIYRAAKLPLGLALGTGLLLIPGFIFYRGPNVQSSPTTSGPVTISIQPDATTPGAVDVTGLNMLYSVTVSRVASGSGYQDEVTAFDVGLTEMRPAPAHFDDAHGDALDFQTPGPDKIHLQDDRGGWADLHWDGSQFVLDGTYSAGLSLWPNGQMHPAKPNYTTPWGVLLCFITPLVACVFVGWFLIQWCVRMGEPFGAAAASVPLVIIGILILVWMGNSMDFQPHEGDVPFGLFYAALFLLFGGPGIGLWCWQMVSVARGMKRLSVEAELTQRVG